MGVPGARSLAQIELDRDWVVRCATGCPTCAAPREQRCHYAKWSPHETMSHVGRYDLAASLGAPVPPIAASPGRGIPVTHYQTIPSGIWTPVDGVAAEVRQTTGFRQNLTLEVDRIRWLNLAHFPELATALLRPPGGVYVAGWVAPIRGSWWVSEAPVSTPRKDIAA